MLLDNLPISWLQSWGELVLFGVEFGRVSCLGSGKTEVKCLQTASGVGPIRWDLYLRQVVQG